VIAPGGKSSNVAAAAAVLGSRVRLTGAVGDDEHGRFLLASAERLGVDVSPVHRLPGHATGTAMIVVDDVGENTIIVSPGANQALAPDLISADDIGSAAVLCLSLEIPIETVVAAAETGRDGGALVVVNLSPYAPIGAELLDRTDVLLLNRSEASLLLGVDQLAPDPARWPALPVPRAVVTLGGDGAVVLDQTAAAGAAVVPIPPMPVDVVDTTGSGDAFAGALAHRLAAGDALASAARFAARAGALAATRPGAQSSYSTFRGLQPPGW
jgi:ribokinase